MIFEGCTHVDPDSGEKFCDACKRLIYRDREIAPGLQRVPTSEVPSRGTFIPGMRIPQRRNPTPPPRKPH